MNNNCRIILSFYRWRIVISIIKSIWIWKCVLNDIILHYTRIRFNYIFKFKLPNNAVTSHRSFTIIPWIINDSIISSFFLFILSIIYTCIAFWMICSNITGWYFNNSIRINKRLSCIYRITSLINSNTLKCDFCIIINI